MLLSALALPFALLATPGAARAATVSPVSPGSTVSTVSTGDMCDVSAPWHCYGETLRAVTPKAATVSGSGIWDASALERQYGVTDMSAPKPGNPTVAVVEAFGYPKLAADLAVYRKRMGLPACTKANKCLHVINQAGKSSPLPKVAPRKDDWTGETALDVDMVSAVCPSCNILVVEADDDGTAVNAAGVPLHPFGILQADKVAARRTHWVSDSWGGPGDASDDAESDRQYLSTPGTILTVASGDDAYDDHLLDGKDHVDYPSTSPYAVAVGGVNGDLGGSLKAWQYGGSSCATFVPTPAAQAGVTRGCASGGYGRAASDVSAIADGSGGIATYDSTYPLKSSQGPQSWIAVEGTSASAPIVAALYAASRNHTDQWRPYETVSQTPSLWDDLTRGRNGSCGTALCDAAAGWDGPTGVGMPLSPEAFALPLAAFDPVAGFSAHLSSPLSATIAVPLTARDTAGDPQRLASASLDSSTITGLPDGVTATASGDHLVLTGTPTAKGSGTATVSVTGVTPAGRTTSGQMSIPWTVGNPLMATSGTPRISGHAVHGDTLRVVLPTMHAETTTGTVLQPAWAVTWFLNGKAVGHARSYHLPRDAAHERVRVSATASLSGYATRTLRSAVEQVR